MEVIRPFVMSIYASNMLHLLDLFLIIKFVKTNL